MDTLSKSTTSHCKSFVPSFLLGQWNVCRFLVTEVLALEICSSYHLVAITVTRYIAIVYPLRYHLYVTTKSTKFVISAIWILSQGVCIVMYTIYNPGTISNTIQKYEGGCRYLPPSSPPPPVRPPTTTHNCVLQHNFSLS